MGTDVWLLQRRRAEKGDADASVGSRSESTNALLLNFQNGSSVVCIRPMILSELAERLSSEASLAGCLAVCHRKHVIIINDVATSCYDIVV